MHGYGRAWLNLPLCSMLVATPSYISEFSGFSVVMPHLVWDLEPAGMLRRWRKEGKQERMGNPVQRQMRHIMTYPEPLGIKDFFRRNWSATCNHQDWYCITNYNQLELWLRSMLSPQDRGVVSTLTIWIQQVKQKKSHCQAHHGYAGLSYDSHQTGHLVGVYLLPARLSRNLMNESIDLFLHWDNLSTSEDSKVNTMSQTTHCRSGSGYVDMSREKDLH